MTNSASSLRWLQVGTQTGVTDTPGAFTFIDAQNQPIVPDAMQGKLDVSLQNADGEKTAAVLGAKTGGINITTLIRGDGTAAGNAAVAAVTETKKLMDAALGFTGQAGTGDTSDNDTHTTTSIKLSDTSLFYDGTSGAYAASCYMVDVGSGVYEAREVATVNANTDLVPDRAHSAAPAAEAVLYAGTSWYLDADNTAHDHLYVKCEGANWRRDLLGCSVGLSANFPTSALATFEWALQANDWNDEAEENPTYSAATSASGLVVLGSPFYIGATKTELIEGSLDFGISPQRRVATEGNQGGNGFIYTYGGAQFSGRIYHDDTTLATMQSATTIDIAFQLGTSPANAWYFRIPALDVKDAKIVEYNGIDAIEFSGTATRPIAGKGSVRVHCFGKAA